MEKIPIWQETIEVRTYESDPQGKWKPAAFFRAMEEATVHHSRNLGVDYFSLQKVDLAWILVRSKVKFHSFPQFGTKIQIQTWPKGWQQKIFGMRDYEMQTLDGQPIAQATTAWLLVDTNTWRFVKPDRLPYPLPDNNGKSALDEPLEKLTYQEDLQEMGIFQARYSTLDVMGHVNNTHYIDWIFDCFTQEQISGRTLDWLQINYSNEVRPDEEVCISVGRVADEANVYAVNGTNQDNNTLAFEARFALK